MLFLFIWGTNKDRLYNTPASTMEDGMQRGRNKFVPNKEEKRNPTQIKC